MKRIQRKRTKGWRMPINTKYVGRPTKWGNPFMLIGSSIFLDVRNRHKNMSVMVYVGAGNVQDTVDLFECVISGKLNNKFIGMIQKEDFGHWVNHFKGVDFSELVGKDLACWCPPNRPCHVDVIIKHIAKDNNKPKNNL